MLVWDPVSERNLPFGTLKTAALGLITVFLQGTSVDIPAVDKSKKELNPRPCCKASTELPITKS